MTHCGNQNHDRAHKNLAPQEAVRRWSVTLATTVACAAEAVPPITVVFNIGRITSGFAWVFSAMQTAAAGASAFSALRRKIFIEFQKEFVKTGICEQSLVQNIASFTLVGKGDKETPSNSFNQDI